MRAITLTILFFIAMPITAGSSSVNGDGVANDGYDVVAYHTQHEAVRGSKTYSASHDGATYYFLSQEHKDKFKANPKNYLPKYDGYCAFAVAKHNSKVKADPETFKLSNGDLYLFFNDFFEGNPTNTIVFWNGAEKELNKQADKNWNTLSVK